jgi:FkbM family methyltransferase
MTRFLVISKAYVRLWIPPIIWNSVRLFWGNLKGSFASDGLDRKILERLGNRRGGFYVDIGANDGLRASNTAILEFRYGWAGVLVEPIPHKFLELTQNRSKKNYFVCKACVSKDYKGNFVELLYADTMTVAVGLESDIASPEGHVQVGMDFIPHEKTFSFFSPAICLQEVLEASGSPKEIDFLSLDVEGSEIEVLKGVDFQKFRFNLMLIECRDTHTMELFMNTKGYSLSERLSERDLLFVPCGEAPLSI